MAQASSRPLDRNVFKIAIICALPSEADMVESIFDKFWDDDGEGYGKAVGDQNTYTTGIIGNHDVVLAYMPGIGSNSAAVVAAGLRMSYSGIEIAFVVGICGVLPINTQTEEEIILGDCVISTAVVQCDFGRQHPQPQGFIRKAKIGDNLGRASIAVRSLMSMMQTRRNRQQLTNRLVSYLQALQETISDARYPGIQQDRLYNSSYMHCHHQEAEPCNVCLTDTEVCSKSCESIGCQDDQLIYRKRLQVQQASPNNKGPNILPKIHFGQFGSTNTVMRSGLDRDRMARENELIAFEMEGSGVWDNFPTIVIKSACDYADSHKNKKWQPYAAATAACGLKAVLERVELSNANITRNTSLGSSKKRRASLDVQTLQQESNTLNETEAKCLQMFYILPSYQEIKDLIPKSVHGTCLWFLSQKAYQRWLVQTGGCLLISADPGCGKSVLAKHLVDNELQATLKDTQICYFFFKDQIQNTLCSALCSILHQLLSKEQYLLRKHVVVEYQKFGERLANNIRIVIDTLILVIRDFTTNIVIVLDALDECEEADQIRLLNELHLLNCIPNLKILLTSRPYDTIVSRYNSQAGASRVHIPGEDESGAVSKEVNLVIKHRLSNLFLRNRFDEQIRLELEERLLSESHRTYLWVYLIFDELEKSLKKTRAEMHIFLRSLPRTVNEAYEKILNRFTSDDFAVRGTVSQALHVLLAAKRPLSISEMQCAVKMQLSSPTMSYDELDLEPDEDFRIKLRNWCGLFIQIHNHKVTFLHQTGREFLLSEGLPHGQENRNAPQWCGSISHAGSHTLTAQICMVFLSLDRQEIGEENTQIQEFLQYSRENWDIHLGVANDEKLHKKALVLCNPQHTSSRKWLSQRQIPDPFESLLHTCSGYAGLDAVFIVAASLQTDQLLRFILKETKQDLIRRRELLSHAITCASASKRSDNIQLLLDRGKECHPLPYILDKMYLQLMADMV